MESEAESIVYDQSAFKSVKECASNIRKMTADMEELCERLVAEVLDIKLITITFKPNNKNLHCLPYNSQSESGLQATVFLSTQHAYLLYRAQFTSRNAIILEEGNRSLEKIFRNTYFTEKTTRPSKQRLSREKEEEEEKRSSSTLLTRGTKRKPRSTEVKIIFTSHDQETGLPVSPKIIHLNCGHKIWYEELRNSILSQFSIGPDNKTARLFYNNKRPTCTKCSEPLPFQAANRIFDNKLDIREYGSSICTSSNSTFSSLNYHERYYCRVL